MVIFGSRGGLSDLYGLCIHIHHCIIHYSPLLLSSQLVMCGGTAQSILQRVAAVGEMEKEEMEEGGIGDLYKTSCTI